MTSLPQPLAPDPTIEAKVRYLSGLTNADGTRVEVLETRMSWVFLFHDRVLKLKKPVRNAVLDFATLGARKRAVDDELRLNRRLAPDVYLATRALRAGASGGLALNGTGRIVDWLVEMRRLPANRALGAMIEAGQVRQSDVLGVAETLAAFYAGLVSADLTFAQYIDRFETEHAKTAKVIADPFFEIDRVAVQSALSGFDAALAAALPFLRDRVRAGRIVEGHGDLRPEHVFLTDPVVIIDCLEFNRALRTVDPFDELTFLGLECTRLGAPWIFETLSTHLSQNLKDDPPPPVIAFYWRYRALLRAGLCLAHLTEPVIRKPAKWRPLALRYLALSNQPLVSPRRRADQ